MRAASARRSSKSSVRGIADKNTTFYSRDIGLICSKQRSLPQGTQGDKGAQEKNIFCTVSAIRALPGGHADALPQLRNLVEHAVRNFPLRSLRNFDHVAVRDDSDSVTIGIKANALARNVVR